MRRLLATLLCTVCIAACGTAAAPSTGALHGVATAARPAASGAAEVRTGTSPGHGRDGSAMIPSTAAPSGHAIAPGATSGITIALSAQCVVPGSAERLTISTGAPSSVSYDTRYADGRLGTQGGGAGVGRTAADGTYRTAWTVPATAALGTATVSAGASRGGRLWTAAPATFTVASRC